MQKNKFLIFAVFLIGFSFFVSPALALEPLVPCGRTGQPPCTTCDFLVLGKNISDFILFYLVPGLAALFFIWAGFLILLGGAIPSKIAKGRAIFQNTAYGLIIIFLAWLIVNTVLRTVAGDENIAEKWWKLECREPQVKSPPVNGGEVTISDLAVPESEITDTTAVIQWTTNKPAASQVQFTDSLGKERLTAVDSNLVTSHFVTLTSLNPKTNYSVVAKSGGAVSSAISFKTKESDEGGGGVLNFLTDTNLPDGVINQSYSVKLVATGGRPPYTFSVEGGDKSLPEGLKMASDGIISGIPTKLYDIGRNFTAQVEDSSDPKARLGNSFAIKVLAKSSPVVISAVAAKNTTANSVTITWTTDKPAASQVEYGATTSYGSTTNLDSTLKTSHSVTINKLAPNTTYHFRALSRATGFPARSSDNTFKTLAGSETACKYTGVNLCLASSSVCSPVPSCSTYSEQIKKAANSTTISGINMTALIRAIMYNESSCKVAAKSSSTPPSCGLMQLQPATANKPSFKAQCGVNADITCDWLRNPANAEASICIGAKYLKSLADGTCGANGKQIRNIAAGYNGGALACQKSGNCRNDKSCDGDNPVLKWECLYDDDEHTVCNGAGNKKGFDETRGYAPKVSSCYNANNR